MKGVAHMADYPDVVVSHGYDELMNWDVRLAVELPFFKDLFRDRGVNRLVDIGAGTGHHAIEFAKWGHHVLAVEPSDDMFVLARQNRELSQSLIDGAGGSVRLIHDDSSHLEKLTPSSLDAIICSGNTLPHFFDYKDVECFFGHGFAALRSGGVLLLQLLNHGLIQERKPIILNSIVRETPQGTRLFLRLVDYPDDEPYFDIDFITLTRSPIQEWFLSEKQSSHLILEVSHIEDMLQKAGFQSIELFGDYKAKAFDECIDENVIVIASK
jgi:SAM-dependent methyltransferase